MEAEKIDCETVDIGAVRELFRLAREFVSACDRLQESLDETISDSRVIGVVNCDNDRGVNTADMPDLALCLRLGNCLEDSWGDQ